MVNCVEGQHLTLIRWIVIYPVDSAIQLLNNRGLVTQRNEHHHAGT